MRQGSSMRGPRRVRESEKKLSLRSQSLPRSVAWRGREVVWGDGREAPVVAQHIRKTRANLVERDGEKESCANFVIFA